MKLVKPVCLALSIGLLLSSSPFAFADTQTTEPKIYNVVDISGHWAEPQMIDLMDAGLVSGYIENGQMYAKPDQKITRAEFVTILMRALGNSVKNGGKTFNDVSPSSYYAASVQEASALGIVSGYADGGFHPDALIKRNEIAEMIVRAFTETGTIDFTAGTPVSFVDVPNDWAKQAINEASNVGIINGFGNGVFAPNNNATRAQAITMISNALHKETTDLPDDKVLTNVILESENQTETDINSSQWDALSQLDAMYYTGFSKAYNESALQTLNSLIAKGGTVQTSLTGTPKMTVISKNTRFAKVQVSGWDLTLTMTYQGKTFNFNDKGNENQTYALIKEGDTWKIYNDTEQ